MAGSEDGGPPDESSEWSDFSSNSSTTNTFEDVPFAVRSQDPVSVINTLLKCFPVPSDFQSAAFFNGAPSANERILDRVDPALETYGEPLIWRGCETEVKFSGALNLLACTHENHLPPLKLEEDTHTVLTRTFDFHKFAEKFNSQPSCQRWSTDSNELTEDFGLTNESEQLPNNTVDSDSENEDEIFLVFRGKPNSRRSTFDECQAAAGLSELSNGELLDLKQEMAAYVKEYSDILVEELTAREELEREKEMKNKFISTLLAVQSRIRELKSGQGKGKKGSSSNSGKYLTTVIPYDDFAGGPSNKVLLRLIEIMEALIADSPTVPSLLTEYILKVLCAED